LNEEERSSFHVSVFWRNNLYRKRKLGGRENYGIGK
jgi:hypothetical protein